MQASCSFVSLRAFDRLSSLMSSSHVQAFSKIQTTQEHGFLGSAAFSAFLESRRKVRRTERRGGSRKRPANLWLLCTCVCRLLGDCRTLMQNWVLLFTSLPVIHAQNLEASRRVPCEARGGWKGTYLCSFTTLGPLKAHQVAMVYYNPCFSSRQCLARLQEAGGRSTEGNTHPERPPHRPKDTSFLRVRKSQACA